MEITRIKPLLIVLVLMIASVVAASRIGEPQLASEVGVRRSLPPRVGRLTLQAMLYCSNADCAEAFSADEFEQHAERRCPLCEAPLDTMSPIERQLLPTGTEVMRGFYRDPQGTSFFVSVVIGGRDRMSLHRPENCLPGQGLSIRDSRLLETQLENDGILRTRLLDVRRQVGGSDTAVFSHFTYWYIAPERETSSQWQLYKWIAADRLFHARMDRWAYIAVAHDFHPRQEQDSLDQLRAFLTELRPLMLDTHAEPERG